MFPVKLEVASQKPLRTYKSCWRWSVVEVITLLLRRFQKQQLSNFLSRSVLEDFLILTDWKVQGKKSYDERELRNTLAGVWRSDLIKSALKSPTMDALSKSSLNWNPLHSSRYIWRCLSMHLTTLCLQWDFYQNPY